MVGAKQVGIQVIARAASILRALETRTDGLSLGAIANEVDLPRSTVQRIVGALLEEQLLIASTPNAGVKLGPAILRLAGAASQDYANIIHPFMEQLSRDVNETVDLSVLEGIHAVFIDQVPCKHRLRAVSAVGERFPLHSMACGKMFLAHAHPDELDSLLTESMKSASDFAHRDISALKAEVKKARLEGVAFDIDEHTEGISAVGTAFRDPVGRLYSLSIPAPSSRFARNRDQMTKAILECRDRIESALGSTKPFEID
ncbi:MAG: IclR family transcriptional regulator [Pseudomonadota bacterium]